MLDDVVLMLRGSADHEAFKPKPTNLELLCQTCVNELQQSTGAQHHLKFVTDGLVRVAVIDEILVSRILINLLSNAIKFSPAGSDVRLELHCDEHNIILRVVDHGMGIASEDQARIFEPFFRTETAREIAGTGLGLNIVRDCVQRHDGRIEVSSQPGVGTTFTIFLPTIR
jgi:signal transduction histidine kinase